MPHFFSFAFLSFIFFFFIFIVTSYVRIKTCNGHAFQVIVACACLFNAISYLVLLLQLKRKSRTENCELESSEWMTSPVNTEAVNSPLHTPISGKGSRTCIRSKGSKYTKSGPQSPLSNIGKEYSYSSNSISTC